MSTSKKDLEEFGLTESRQEWNVKPRGTGGLLWMHTFVKSKIIVRTFRVGGTLNYVCEVNGAAHLVGVPYVSSFIVKAESFDQQIQQVWDKHVAMLDVIRASTGEKPVRSA